MKLAEGISQEDIKLFLAEADEQIQLLDEDIVRLERESDNSNLLQEIFRASHTIKGSSAMIGHQRMSRVAHGMENVLDKVRKRTIAISPGVVDVLLEGLDILKILKEELLTGEENSLDIEAVLRELDTVNNTADILSETCSVKEQPDSVYAKSTSDKIEVPSEGQHTYHIKVTINKDTGWVSVRCFQIVQELTRVSNIISSTPSLSDIENEKGDTEIDLIVTSNKDEKTIKDVLISVPELESVTVSSNGTSNNNSSAPEKPETLTNDTSTVNKDIEMVKNPVDIGTVKKDASGVKQTVRVDVSRLDVLMEQIGELVINRNHISQIGKTLAEKYQDDELVRSLNDSLSLTVKIVNTLQQDIMTIRMLPIDLVFNTMPRMVRDLARKTGKDIDFIIEGNETEVDRSVIEHLRDPLIHLLRNSVDHGIESPAKRSAIGKQEKGTIRLSAFHEQDHIVITVSDDGKGIDSDVVKAASIKKGLITPEIASRLSDNEAVNLIMMSGVSTAKQVSEVSGRGVGMDIVRKNIERLNGTISIDSNPGKGTQFTLILPLTLAIIPTLLVSIDRTVCAIPLNTIDEAIQLYSKDIKTVLGKEVTLYRNNVLPLLRLNSIFKWNSESTERRTLNRVVVVKAHETHIGIIVDELIGQQEIVVKSLDQFVGGANGISGASILGDGQVVLILDVASLVKSTITDSQNSLESKEPQRIPALSVSK
ncbi:MAG: chemotaxis protein CheA [Dehalococcoidales bacterium]|nr:chemotaxis protein CheA [Dehalococcoidales bacterium]